MSKKLKIKVIDSEGKTVGEKDLSLAELESEPILIAQMARAFLANQRKARAKTKTRTEVEGSKSKIYRQKGTGRARHGDRQAPIFVGGGVAHGPTGGQNYHQKVNKKASRKAILSLLADKISQKQLFLLDKFDFKKTKEVAIMINKIKEDQKTKKVGIVYSKDKELLRLSRNIEDVQLTSASSLSSYFLLKTDTLLLTNSALEEIENLNKKNV